MGAGLDWRDLLPFPGWLQPGAAFSCDLDLLRPFSIICSDWTGGVVMLSAPWLGGDPDLRPVVAPTAGGEFDLRCKREGTTAVVGVPACDWRRDGGFDELAGSA